jgi:quercetin dioxygenase-like cupin family protein
MAQSGFAQRRVLAVLTLVGGITAVALVGSGLAQQPGGFASNFTGTIRVVDSSEMGIARIHFEAGARTNWHVHSEPQLIVIEQGRGLLQELGGPVRELLPGQPVYTQAGVPHWHGASPDEEAMQFSAYSGELQWMEPVTDAQYRGEAGR